MPSEWRRKNPVRYAYQTLKDNAKRRGHKFEISLEYFREFCFVTGYIKRKGIYKKCYGVDRIIPHLGYVEGNLRLVTNTHNLKRRYYADYDELTQSMVYTMEVTEQEKITDCPF